MKHLAILVLFLSSAVILSNSETCKTKENVMDCSGLNFTDCPPVVLNVTRLILDDNALTNFSSSHCQSWMNLQHLSARRNQFTSFPNLNGFLKLDSIDISRNKLVTFNFGRSSVRVIDVSMNLIMEVNIHNLLELTKLNVSGNSMNKTIINELLGGLSSSTKLKVLDLSHNSMDSIPINFMTFVPIYLSSLNLSYNHMISIYFDSFNDIIGSQSPYLHLDLSNNGLANWIITKSHTFTVLGLSHNKLSNILAEDLDKFLNLKSIDFYDNPLNCMCNESAPFVNWMHRHTSIIARPSKIKCKFPPGVLVLNMSCPQISSTLSPRISTTFTKDYHSSKLPIRSTTHDFVSSPPGSISPPMKQDRWKIIVGACVGGVIIFAILIGAIIYRRKHGFTKLIAFNKMCPQLQFIHFQRTESESLISQDEPPDLVCSDEYINSLETLNIVCSSKDFPWVSEIFQLFRIRNQIISTKLKKWPSTDFTLIVVNGDVSLKDRAFMDNVAMALKMKDVTEIRLLIRNMPSFVNLMPENPITEFVRHVMFDRSYFNYDDINTEACIERLKLWMNLDS